jgi:tRNA threonylcarbamoyladenosine biosynthesis protein TsaE
VNGPAPTLFLPDAAATEAFGARLAASLPPRAVVYLEGDLGAGKSSLARALLRGLGVRGPVRSPTYTLVERYAVPGGEAAHLDLYRLGEAAELDFLALDELAETARLWLVEWPDRGAGHLPPADLVLRLAVEGQGRRVRFEAASGPGRAWVAALVAGAAPGGDGPT